MIAIENQGLGEAVDIVGTPFRLHYQSDRMPGRTGTSGNAPFDTRELGLGGWTLDVHHAYPYYNRTLYLGDGTKRSPDALGAIFKVTQASPHLAVGEGVIASNGGGELYVFENQPPSDRHLRTLDALTGAVRYRFSYDARHQLASITDSAGNVTKIERNPMGKPTAIVAPFGQRTALVVDANGYLSKITNPAAETFWAQYTSDGLLTRFTDPLGNIRNYTYDGLGRLIHAADPTGRVKTLGRTNQPQGYTVNLAAASGRTTTYQVENTVYDSNPAPEHLLRRTVTFSSGLRAVSVDDPSGVLVTDTEDGVHTKVETARDPRWGKQVFLPKKSTIDMPSGLASNATTTRTVTLADPSDPVSLATQTDTVTENGRTYTGTYTAATKTYTATTPQSRQVRTTVDAQGRVVQEQIAGVLPVSYMYDNHSRLTAATQDSGATARSLTFSYNTEGYLSTTTDPLGRKEKLDYDAAGRVTAQTFPDGRVVHYRYDANGNLTTFTPPGRPAHGFAFTPVDLPSTYNPPSVGAGTNQTRYAYNADQDLSYITRPDGQTVSVGYNSAGRLNALTIPRGTLSYAYDPTTGNLATIDAPGGIGLAYSYDGALPIGEAWVGPIAGEVKSTYDQNFRVISRSINGANTTNFQYDNDGLLVGAGALALSYNTQNGLFTGSRLDSVTDTLTYNGFAEPINYIAATNGTSLFKALYIRDKLGRITQKTETIGGVTDTYVYIYDLAGRLKEVKKNNTTIARYTYDSNSNRLSFSSPNGTITGIYDKQDRLTKYGGSTYAYTANGELQSKTAGGKTTTYDYDVLGELLSVTLPYGTVITYLVDGRNRRVGKKVNGALVQGFLYQDGLRPVVELDGSNTVVSRFVYASRSNVPDYLIRGGVTYRIIADHLGSPRLVVNTSTGQTVQRMDYDAFGNVTLDTNPGFQPFGFAGGLYDRDIGFVRFGARDYDPEVGRWTTKDPIQQVPDFVQAAAHEGYSVSTYAYALNNPVAFSDETGLYAIFGDSFNACFSSCLDRENARVINYIIPFAPVPKACLPPFRTPIPSQPFTTPLSSLAHLLGGRANPFGSFLRGAGRVGSRTVAVALFAWSGTKTGACFAECSSAKSVAE